MGLSEQEEFELLSLERERSMASGGSTVVDVKQEEPKKESNKYSDMAFKLASSLFPGLMPHGDDPVIRKGIENFMRGEVSGVLRKDMGQEGVAGEAGKFVGEYGPTVAATTGAALATGGASVPVQMAASGLAGAAVESGKQIVSGAVGGETPKSGKEAAKDILIEGGLQALGPGVVSLPAAFLKANKKGLVKFGAQLIKGTSGVPEKYGEAVLSNPDILSKAPTMEVAKQLYKKAINGLQGAREYLESETGSILQKVGPSEDLINTTIAKIGTSTPPSLQEALAARQSVAFLTTAAKFGNPEQRANLGALLKAKDTFDDFLEAGGLSGIKGANKTYFEANAKEAFRSVMPLRKNMSADAMRVIWGLSELSAAAMLKAPFAIIPALALSPRLAGLAIKAANESSKIIGKQGAIFMSNLAAKATAEQLKAKNEPTSK